jgi:predicted nucleic acid-binding protein
LIYLDSSAVVKLIRPEGHSRALEEWLTALGDRVRVSSVLVEVDAAVRTLAAGYPRPTLRTLDAIHLATAQVVSQRFGGAWTFVAYDDRLLAAAQAEGFPIARPT